MLCLSILVAFRAGVDQLVFAPNVVVRDFFAADSTVLTSELQIVITPYVILAIAVAFARSGKGEAPGLEVNASCFWLFIVAVLVYFESFRRSLLIISSVILGRS